MTPTSPTNGSHPSNDPHLAARRLATLAREMERATRRIAGLEELTRLLDTMLRQLAADVALLAPTPDDEEEEEVPSPVRSWLAADDPEQACAQLVDLVDWVRAVYVRYPGGALPSCWLWHPAVVEELWWLRHAHHAAYHGRGACWREVGDWHDRQRPGVARRINQALADCELSRHVPGADRHQPSPAVPLAAAAVAIAEHWTTDRGTPDPTDQQLTEADQHDRAQHRTRR